MAKGKLIVLEGVDAVGKTSLCTAICDELNLNSIQYEMLSFPGKTPGDLGELVYRLHHNHTDIFHIAEIDPLALQTMHIAAHIDLINRRIKGIISSGTWVVLDRYWWSTYVYGLDAGIPPNQIQALVDTERLVWGEYKPDLMVFIDSDKPLRVDEVANQAWNNKRQRYTTLANNENSFCVIRYVNKDNSLNANDMNKQRASEIISMSMDL